MTESKSGHPWFISFSLNNKKKSNCVMSLSQLFQLIALMVNLKRMESLNVSIIKSKIDGDFCLIFVNHYFTIFYHSPIVYFHLHCVKDMWTININIWSGKNFWKEINKIKSSYAIFRWIVLLAFDNPDTYFSFMKFYAKKCSP